MRLMNLHRANGLNITLTEEFTGFPNLLKQLNEDQKTRVEHLPKELVILARYNNVGISTVEKLFRQLKEKKKEN
ncbi:hypothetical protein D3C74_385960 [compost metagenome]